MPYMAAERLGTAAPLSPVTEDERAVSALIRPAGSSFVAARTKLTFAELVALVRLNLLTRTTAASRSLRNWSATWAWAGVTVR